ncbi:AraC family transcriptional regulator, partial [bacterium]|nr:AraC family transcriptional regulator [bacterium]
MARTGSSRARHVRRVRHSSPGHATTENPASWEKCWVNAGLDDQQPIGIVRAGESDWGPNGHYEKVGSDLFALELVLGGSGVVEVNGAQHLFVPGDMLFIGPKDNCRFYTGPARRWHKTYMAFRPEGAAAIISQLNLDGVCHIRLAKTAFRHARQRFSSLVEAVRDKPGGFRERVSALGYELLLITAQAAQAGKPRGSYPSQVQRALLHAETHQDMPLTVRELARAAGCSRQHLSDLFTTHLGIGVHEWLTRWRINR